MDLTQKVAIEFTGKDNLSQSVNNISKNINGLISAAKFLGTVFVTGVVAKGMKYFVDQAREAENVNKKLTARLEALGYTSKTAVGNVTELAASLQRMTNYSDEQTIEVFTHLLNVTNNYNVALQHTKTALDLAAATGLELSTATRLLGYAYEGQTGILSRYINVNLEGKKGLEALNIIMEKVKGTAEKTADPITIFTNKTNELAENLGKKILPAINNFIDELNNLIDIMSPAKNKQEEAIKILAEAAKKYEEIMRQASNEAKMYNVSVQDVINSNSILKAQMKEVEELRKRANDLMRQYHQELVVAKQKEQEIAVQTEQTIEQQQTMWEKLGQLMAKYENLVANINLRVAKGFGQLVMRVENAWQNMLTEVLNMILDAAQQELAIWATKELAKMNIAGFAAGMLGIAALEALQIGITRTNVATESGIETTGGGETISSPGGGGTSTTTVPVETVSRPTGGGGVLQIYIQHPTFLSEHDFRNAINEIFRVAQNNGWQISNPGFSVTGD